jgi:hypothetical protein
MRWYPTTNHCGKQHLCSEFDVSDDQATEEVLRFVRKYLGNVSDEPVLTDSARNSR